MVYSIHFSAEALTDQESIVLYLVDSLGNREAARHFIDELEKIVSALEKTPGAFPFSHDARLKSLKYQKALFMNYVLLFRVEGEMVYLARIFHQSQDYAKLI